MNSVGQPQLPTTNVAPQNLHECAEVRGRVDARQASAAVLADGFFRILVWGDFQGRVTLERSFDNGRSFSPMLSSSGAVLHLQGPGRLDAERHEPEPTLFRMLGSDDLTGIAQYLFTRQIVA